jgi:RHS repeat-associated protein
MPSQPRVPGGIITPTRRGLRYNYFRDYDAVTGRYVESDPIGLRGGPSSYGYAFANPLAYTDPLGLDASLYSKDPGIADPSDYTGPPLPLPTLPGGWSPGPFGPFCGPQGSVLATWIPDGGKALTAACVEHDKCYETCGASKFWCDLNLYVRGNFAYGLAVFFSPVAKDRYQEGQKHCKDCQ